MVSDFKYVCVDVEAGGSRQPRRGRQAVVVTVLCMHGSVFVYRGDVKEDGKESDMFHCVSSVLIVFHGHFLLRHIYSTLFFVLLKLLHPSNTECTYCISLVALGC